MLPSGQPASIGGAQSSLIRSNSGMFGAQGGSVSSQSGYPSVMSPHNSQYNGINLLGNVPNGTSLLSQSYGNAVLNAGNLGPGNSQRGGGGMDEAAEADTLSSAGNGPGFTSASSPFAVNPGSSFQRQGEQVSNPSGNQLISDQQQSQVQQGENQNFQLNQHPYFASHHGRQQQQQHTQLQSNRVGFGGVGAVKAEPPHVTNDQNGQQHQLQSIRNIGQVKWEQQNHQNIRSLAPIKVEPQHSDQSLFLHQQQQQLLQLSRQSPQAAAVAQNNMLQQQRLFQQLQAMPQQQSQLQNQFAPQNLPLRSPVKSLYEPGMCARRLTSYMHRQQQRPKDNNIEFWREFVAEFFAPHAKKKWCVSMYGSGRQTTGVFPQDVRHCEICNRKPGRGFEATVEVLPRLFKIKYDSGTLEELLYVDMPHEYPNASGQIVLDYAKAIQESVYDQLRVVREGQLRIVFSPSPGLKICSWEFCAKSHEEVIPRRVLIPQVSQLGSAAQKYQTASQNASNSSLLELQNSCDLFVASARHLAKFMEVPLVNDLGYTKRYVRCLQISEVVNSMKDLIDYSRETEIGPMESLNKFPRRTNSTSCFNGEPQQSEEQQKQQTNAENSNNGQTSLQATGIQLPANNSVPSVNNSLNSASTSASPSTIVGLLRQNSMNPRPPNPTGNAIPNQIQANNPQQVSHNPSNPSAHMSSTNTPANISVQQAAPSGEADPSESQSSVHKIIQDLMMSSSFGSDSKNNNSGFNGRMVMNGAANINTGMMGNSSIASINGGRVGMAQMVRQQSMNHHHQQHQQQQGSGNQTMNGLNGFNNFQFD